MAIYYGHLDDLSIEAVRYAASEVIRNEERFPVVAVIRKYAKQYKPPKLDADLNRTVITEATYTDELADKFFGEVMPMFGDGWGLATTRRTEVI